MDTTNNTCEENDHSHGEVCIRCNGNMGTASPVPKNTNLYFIDHFPESGQYGYYPYTCRDCGGFVCEECLCETIRNGLDSTGYDGDYLDDQDVMHLLEIGCPGSGNTDMGFCFEHSPHIHYDEWLVYFETPRWTKYVDSKIDG
jgi:hypothetical protein